MKKTSVIVTCWEKMHFMAFASMATLSAIRAFTNPEEYELIIIETKCPPHEPHIVDYHGNLELEKATHIVRTEDQGYSADMNQGAKLATGDYLAFVENDVIVHENWLPDLRYYLDHDICDVVIPNQVYETYEKMQEHKLKTFEEDINGGIQEQGLMMIRKDTFEKAGGWDDRFRKVFAWKAFQLKLNKLPVCRVYTTNKVYISHIAGMSYWHSVVFDHEEYSKVGTEEDLILEKEYA